MIRSRFGTFTPARVVAGDHDLSGRNVVFTSKQEWQKDEVTGISRYGPMMPGQKLGPQLPYLFDEVFSGHDTNNPVVLFNRN